MNNSEAIKELSKMTDSEETPGPSLHVRADEILCAVLRANGLGAVADEYEKTDKRIGFWYE